MWQHLAEISELKSTVREKEGRIASMESAKTVYVASIEDLKQQVGGAA